MSKIVVDQIQKSGGDAFSLPTSDGTAGQFIKTDGAGALSFIDGPTSPQTSIISKAFALTGGGSTTSYADTNKIMWTDVKSGITLADIASIRISGYTNATTNHRMYAIGADAAGSAITTGYLGFGYVEWYNGASNTTTTSHNSNSGWTWWPGYTTAYGTNSDTYGNGITWTYTLIPNRNGNTGGQQHHIQYMYAQDTSYNFPNYGQIAWDNYASSAAPASWHGIFIYPTAGTFDTTNNNNVVTVEILTNNAV